MKDVGDRARQVMIEGDVYKWDEEALRMRKLRNGGFGMMRELLSERKSTDFSNSLTAVVGRASGVRVGSVEILMDLTTQPALSEIKHALFVLKAMPDA